MISRIGLTWQLSEFFGWGIFGWNIAKVLNDHPEKRAVLLTGYNPDLTPDGQKAIAPLLKEWQENYPKLVEATKSGKKIIFKDTAVLHGLGNNFAFASGAPKMMGEKNIGFIFFESTNVSFAGLRRAHSLDAVFAGSRWNAELLRGAGIKKVAYVMQGVDVQRYGAVKRSKKYKDRFVIFSGGKLEYRKGQDIVVKAFKIFQEKHPDALLLTLWGNKWPQITKDLVQSPHQLGVPLINSDNTVNLLEWTTRAGIPKNAVEHTGFLPNSELQNLYAHADVALFPNRSEGGTNLVAMELMASGVPCILSANTGHLDLTNAAHCYPLSKQSGIPGDGREGWGESDVDEILEKLELIYSQREEAGKVAQAGRQFMSHYSWENQANALIHLIDGVV